MPDLTLALRDGALLAVAASAVIVGSLRANPRLFMRHFPDALKARIAPLSRREVRAGSVVAAALLFLLVAGPLVSTAMAHGANTPILDLFLHAFVVGMVFNLVDWLVLDELLLGLLKPGWALPPGATEADFFPFDHRRHVRGFATGTVLCAVIAALVAGGVNLLG